MLKDEQRRKLRGIAKPPPLPLGIADQREPEAIKRIKALETRMAGQDERLARQEAEMGGIISAGEKEDAGE